MKREFLTSAALLFLCAGSAHADDLPSSSWYGELLVGPSFDPGLSVAGVKSPLATGYNVGGRIGTTLDDWGLPNFTADMDLFYDQSHYDSGARYLGSTSVMGDLLYHIPTNSPFSFYGGGGIGVVYPDYHLGGLSFASNVFGWQAIGGVEYELSPKWSLFSEYRYQNAHDIKLGGIPGIGDTSDNLSFGIKLKF